MAGFFGLFGGEKPSGVLTSEQSQEMTQESQREARGKIEKELARELSKALGVQEGAVKKTYSYHALVETLVGYATHGQALTISETLRSYGITMDTKWKNERRYLSYFYFNPSIVDDAFAWEELPSYLIHSEASGVDVSEEKIAIVQRYIKSIGDSATSQ
ncbi:MAG TPA: hypothetical protein VJ246_03855 [Patescibacteria group bacterium]|nr:hypothetical protein [Patescibacteria group bacterium]